MYSYLYVDRAVWLVRSASSGPRPLSHVIYQVLEALTTAVVAHESPGSPAAPLFTGWMFASSPALSAVEHPVYDVWVIDCKKASISEAVNTEGN